jgi:hypothetical protein
MRAEHLEFLVEEPSMEAFLTAILPNLFGDRSTFTIHVYQGKSDLLSKLAARLRGYAKWLPDNMRIVVMVDQDDSDCRVLKQRLEADAEAAGLSTRAGTGTSVWQVVNRIAVEELEAWFFGEWAGVRQAYPRASALVVSQAPYRRCDAIAGGTWEAFERIMKRYGYFGGGLRKIEAAREIGRYFNHEACMSPSFATFRDAVIEAVT